MLGLRDYYQVEESSTDGDNLVEALDKILLAQSLDEAQIAKYKAVQKMLTHCLFLMTTNRAGGPKRPETAVSLEADARSLEHFADLDERNGKEELAKKKRKEAAQLKIRAAALRAKGPTV